jgi:hypothetical protein
VKQAKYFAHNFLYVVQAQYNSVTKTFLKAVNLPLNLAVKSNVADAIASM